MTPPPSSKATPLVFLEAPNTALAVSAKAVVVALASNGERHAFDDALGTRDCRRAHECREHRCEQAHARLEERAIRS
jgi:hypothetical protein